MTTTYLQISVLRRLKQHTVCQCNRQRSGRKLPLKTFTFPELYFQNKRLRASFTAYSRHISQVTSLRRRWSKLLSRSLPCSSSPRVQIPTRSTCSGRWPSRRRPRRRRLPRPRLWWSAGPWRCWCCWCFNAVLLKLGNLRSNSGFFMSCNVWLLNCTDRWRCLTVRARRSTGEIIIFVFLPGLIKYLRQCFPTNIFWTMNTTIMWYLDINPTFYSFYASKDC